MLASRSWTSRVTLVSLATLLCGSTAEAQNGRHAFYETPWLSTQVFSFPTFLAGGQTGINVAGDLCWKIFSASSLANAAGSETLTGFSTTLVVHNWTGGPLDLPDVVLRRILRWQGACLRPDLNSPAHASFALGNIVLPSGGAHEVEVFLPPTAYVSVPNGDLAVCVMAPPGQNSTWNDVARGVVLTYEGTATVVPGCRNQMSGLIGKWSQGLGGVYLSYPDWELRLELSFLEPTVQAEIRSSRAVDRGYGATYFSVDDGSRQLAWHVEARQHIGKVAVPLFGLLGASQIMNLGNASILLTPDPYFLSHLIQFGQFGAVVSDGGNGAAEDGVFDTASFRVPQELAGGQFSVAFVFLDAATFSISDATNTCTTFFVP
jgi:hypothetical protein